MTAKKQAASPAPVQQPKEKTVATKEVNASEVLNEVDLSKVDLVALKKFADNAAAVFKQRQEGELKTLVNGWLAKAEALGFTKDDIIIEIDSRFPPSVLIAKNKVTGEKVDTGSTKKGKGTRPSKWQPLDGMEKLDQDKTGARPKLNTTYKLPDGTLWTTKGQLGRTPGEVCKALHAGSTWEAMEDK